MRDPNKTVPNVLTIAGFDGSGGAGLQADLKTFAAFKCYGLSILTTLPIQNTRGVQSIFNIPSETIQQQLHCMFEDVRPDAIKIGVLFHESIIEVVATFLSIHASDIPIVIDPVIVAKSGDRILLESAVASLKQRLLPLARVITPNLPEASELLGTEISAKNQMLEAARALLDLGCKAVVLKGGHLVGTPDDLYMDNKQFIWLKGQKVVTNNNHGTGCTFSAAIAANLARGRSLLNSCKIAKKYIYNALKYSHLLQMGKGHGSTHHFYRLWNNTV